MAGAQGRLGGQLSALTAGSGVRRMLGAPGADETSGGEGAMHLLTDSGVDGPVDGVASRGEEKGSTRVRLLEERGQ